MQIRPLISVVLPTRSRPTLLPRAVASVLAQSYLNLELLVVDDGPSGDRGITQTVLRPWENDPRLKLLPHNEARNASAARNFGLAHASGEWIAFLDDDDAYLPRKLEAQWECASKTLAPLVLCGVRYVLGGRSRQRQCVQNEFRGAQLLFDAQAGTPFIFHRKIDLVRFDETLFAGEDVDYFLRLAEAFAIDSVPNVPEPLVTVYPQSSDTRVNARAAALRQSERTLCLHRAPRFGREATRRAVARAELHRCRWRKTSFRVLWRASRQLWKIAGVQEARLILNTWLLHAPLIRRFLVT